MQRPPWQDRFFRMMLRLFPAEFRGDFAEQMQADFEDQRRETRARVASLRLWVRTTADLVQQAPREHLELLGRDIRYATRLMRRSPGFSAVALLTLALGIGANVAVFSLADGMLFRPLPFRDPERLVLLQSMSRETGQVHTRVDRVDFEHLRKHHRGIAGIATVRNGPSLTFPGSDGAERVMTSEGSPNLLEVLGVAPHIGRLLRAGDELMNPRPAMLTYGAWQRRFGGDPRVMGRTLTFDGQNPVQVVGVLPPRFIYPLQGSLASGELLLATAPDPKDAANPRAGVWSPVARLEPGVSIAQAQSETDLLVRQVAQQYPESTQDRALRIANLQVALFELSRPLLWLLLGAAGCVLLIACVNIAMLLLARGMARDREFGIRSAIGASRARILRQLLVESLMLGLAGGALALMLATVTFHTLTQHVPATFRLVPDGLDGRAFILATVLAVLAGVLFGCIPAWSVSKVDLTVTMREKRRRVRGVMPAGGWMVGAEVALAMILLAGAGLMVNSFVRMRTVDLGFDPGRVLTLAVTLPPAQYATAAAQHEYYAQLLERVRSVPGVLASGGIEYLQVGDARPPRGIRDGTLSGTGIWRVTPGYFEAIGTPILHGRDFSEADVREEASVALVTESVARLLSTGPAPLGQHLRLDDEAEVMIVGVVRDVRSGYGRPTEPSVYRPVTRQELARTIVARAAGDPAAVASAIRAEAQRLEPGAILPQPGLAIAAILDRGIAKATFETALFVIFGLLALLVTAIGVYGLVAFSVSGRTHEMGIRLALGATAAHLKSWVIRQALFPVMAGVATGAAGAFMLTRRLDNLLYGITPHDGPTFVAVVGVLVGVGLLAAYVPARRAARVDPVIALKAE